MVSPLLQQEATPARAESVGESVRQSVGESVGEQAAVQAGAGDASSVSEIALDVTSPSKVELISTSDLLIPPRSAHLAGWHITGHLDSPLRPCELPSGSAADVSPGTGERSSAEPEAIEAMEVDAALVRRQLGWWS